MKTPAVQTVRIACDVKDRIDIDDLVELQGELKILEDAEYEKLKAEILDTGYAFPVYVWFDPKLRGKKKRGYILGGHQRKKTLQRMRSEGIKVPPIPYVGVHAKNIAEAKRRVLQDISQYGKVTSDGLKQFAVDANFEMSDILESFRLPDIDVVQFIAGPSGEDGGGSDSGEAGSYTKKIQAPIYEPKGEKPAITDLYDLTVANRLIDGVNGSGLSEDEKTFLRYAALRHVVFDYEKIAEFYAHGSKRVQELMEDSALVIIDFDKAIERGFVVLSEKIADAYRFARLDEQDQEEA